MVIFMLILTLASGNTYINDGFKTKADCEKSAAAFKALDGLDDNETIAKYECLEFKAVSK